MATSTTLEVPGTSNVLDAATFKASQLNVTLSDDAKGAIEKRVSGPLERLLEKERTLAPYAEDIQKNTYSFIEYVFQTQLDGKPGTITIDHISNALSSYCQKHKNQLPFCR